MYLGSWWRALGDGRAGGGGLGGGGDGDRGDSGGPLGGGEDAGGGDGGGGYTGEAATVATAAEPEVPAVLGAAEHHRDRDLHV